MRHVLSGELQPLSAQSPVFASGASPSADALREAQGRLMADQSLQFQFGPTPPPPPPMHLDLPDWLLAILRFFGALLSMLGPVFGLIFAAGLVLGIGAVLVFAFRETLRARFPKLFKKKPGPPTPKVADWRPDAAVARALLEEADRMAAAGDYAGAARLLLHKSIEEIEGHRPRLVRPAFTSREIAGLGDIPPNARGPFMHIAEVVERSFFGGRPVDADAFARCRNAYQSFALPEAWA